MSLRVDPRAIRRLIEELTEARGTMMASHRRAHPLRVTFSTVDEPPVEPDWDAVDEFERDSRRVAELEGTVGYLSMPCPICGALVFLEEWIDVSTFGGGRSRVPGYWVCPTPRCGEVCKICRREPGDVHGPDCGPLMFPKLERPHIVDESDCR